MARTWSAFVLFLTVFPQVASALPIGPEVMVLFATNLATFAGQCNKSQSSRMSTCLASMQPITLNSFRVVAQASADGSVLPFFFTIDGEVQLNFQFKVPYVYDRRVVIDQSGPVTTATFPVVNRTFRVDASRYVAVDPNAGVGGRQEASAGPVLVAGTGISMVEVLPSVTIDVKFGDGTSKTAIHGSSVLIDRSPWEVPSGDFLLTRFGGPLVGGFVYFDRSLNFEPLDDLSYFAVAMSLSAYSFGSISAGGFHVDGGEAIACLGQNSPMSSFGMDCREDTGVEVSAVWSVDSYVTLLVEFVGEMATPNLGQWRVVSAVSAPEPATLAIFGLGLAALSLMRRRRRAA